MKGPCSLEQIARAIAERILDDWASLSCSGRSGKGNEMLLPSLDVLLAARRSSSDMPVGMDICDARVAGRTNDYAPEKKFCHSQHTARPPLLKHGAARQVFALIQVDRQSRHMDYGHILMLIHYNGQ